METPRFIQTTGEENKAKNKEDFRFFKDDISKAINFTTKILADETEIENAGITETNKKVSLDDDKIVLSYIRLMRNSCIAQVDTQKDNRDFSCVIKHDSFTKEASENYFKNIQKVPALRPYLPEVYEVMQDWLVLEKISGLESSLLQEKLATDEKFLQKFAKNIAEFIYTIGVNNFVTGDVVLGQGQNCMVDPVLGTIKLVEIDNIAPYPSLGYRGESEDFKGGELIASELFMQAGSIINEFHEEKNNLPRWRVDLLLQVFQNIFQKIHPEDLKIKYRYVLPSHPSYQESYEKHIQRSEDKENDKIKMGSIDGAIPHYHALHHEGITINPRLVEYVQTMNIEGLEDFLANLDEQDNYLLVKIPDIPENRVILE